MQRRVLPEMMRHTSFISGLLVGIVIAGVVAFSIYSRYKPSDSGDVVAQMLPDDIKLSTLDGQTASFAKWRGHLLLINFWATWCGPCRKEIPALIRAQKRYGARGLQIVGPAVDDPGVVRRDLVSLGIDYPVLLSPTPEKMIDLMSELGNMPGGLPFSVLVSASGRILQRHLGAFDPQELDTLIEQHLPR